MARAFSWFNYFHDYSDFREWVIKWMKREKYPAEDIHAYSKVKAWKSMPTMGAVARLLMGDSVVPEKYAQALRQKVQAVVAEGRTIREEQEEPAKKPSIQDNVQRAISVLVAEIQEKIDSREQFSMYEFLKGSGAKPLYASSIIERVGAQLEEMRELQTLRKRVKWRPMAAQEYFEYASKRIDDDFQVQLLEAYRLLTPEEVDRAVKSLEEHLSDAERFSRNEKIAKTRKPRKKKEKSAIQVVKNLKCLKESKEHKVVSIDPSSIVGAQQLWVFNAKAKTLTRYDARNISGLSARGTSIIDWDEETSLSKKLRKPDEALKRVLEGGKRDLQKLMDTLTTKASRPSGRTSEDHVLLRTVR